MEIGKIPLPPKLSTNKIGDKKIITCPSCDGAKVIDGKPCADCGGTGKITGTIVRQ